MELASGTLLSHRERRLVPAMSRRAGGYSITSSAVASSVAGTVKPERLGGLEINDELVLGRCLDRQVGRLLALEDAVDIARRAPMRLDVSGP